MNEFIIYIIIGIVAYLLLKKKNKNETKPEDNYEILYTPVKTRSYQRKGSVPDDRKLLYKKANFKIPKYICFLNEIPKGATGKLQRIGLAEKLGLE